MPTERVIEADVVDDGEQGPVSTAVVVREPTAHLSVAPQVEAAELGQRLDVIKQAMQDQMFAGVDYGVIPGTNKPTLLKPGAEKLSVLFQLDVQLENHKEWGPGDHLTVESKATVFHAPTGQRLGYGEGLCTTREKKYGKRRLERECPTCHANALLESRDENRKEFFCWRRKGGCGAKFPIDDPRITSQEVGEVDNPDLPDTWNTVIKMAEKRARVDAILSVTGASALFTQDVEDQQVADNEQPATPTVVAADPALDKQAKEACYWISGQSANAARDLYTQIVRECGGMLPEPAARALVAASDAMRAAEGAVS